MNNKIKLINDFIIKNKINLDAVAKNLGLTRGYLVSVLNEKTKLTKNIEWKLDSYFVGLMK